MKKFDKKEIVDKETILKAVESSAQIEGLSLESAKKNTKVIADLKAHGRAFSL